MGRHELEATVTEHPAACPVCGGAALIRSGHACGRQRWRCKGCGRQFTRTTPRGKPAAMKREAVGWTSPLGVKGSLTDPSTRGGQDGGEEDPAPVHGRVQGGGGPAPARGR